MEREREREQPHPKKRENMGYRPANWMMEHKNGHVIFAYTPWDAIKPQELPSIMTPFNSAGQKLWLYAWYTLNLKYSNHKLKSLAPRYATLRRCLIREGSGK